VLTAATTVPSGNDFDSRIYYIAHTLDVNLPSPFLIFDADIKTRTCMKGLDLAIAQHDLRVKARDGSHFLPALAGIFLLLSWRR